MEEELTYQVNFNALFAEFPGEYVVIYSEEILGIRKTEQEAFQLGKSILFDKPFLVKQLLPLSKNIQNEL